MVVDERDGHPGGLGNLAHRGGIESPFGEHRLGRGKNARLGGFAGLGPFFMGLVVIIRPVVERYDNNLERLFNTR